jgi:hypothetical protein
MGMAAVVVGTELVGGTEVGDTEVDRSVQDDTDNHPHRNNMALLVVVVMERVGRDTALGLVVVGTVGTVGIKGNSTVVRLVMDHLRLDHHLVGTANNHRSNSHRSTKVVAAVVHILQLIRQAGKRKPKQEPTGGTRSTTT